MGRNRDKKLDVQEQDPRIREWQVANKSCVLCKHLNTNSKTVTPRDIGCPLVAWRCTICFQSNWKYWEDHDEKA